MLLQTFLHHLGVLDWKISDAGMSIDDWIWSGSGSLSISGDDITMQGIPGSRVSGILSVELPVNAPPAFHSFTDSSSLAWIIHLDYLLRSCKFTGLH